MGRTPTEGAVYKDERSENVYVCTESPETAGVRTSRAESMPIGFERVSDGEWMSIPVDNFGRKWTKVAKSRRAYESDPDEIPLSPDEREEIEDRARESWGRLAREYGVSEDDVREVIIG